jgi:hypothetical protein
MRSVFMLTLTAWLVGAAAVFAQSTQNDPAADSESAPPAPASDSAADALPIPVPDRSEIPALIGDIIQQVRTARGSAPHRRHQPRSHHVERNEPAPTDAEPVVQASGVEDEGVVEIPPPAPAEDLAEPQPIPQRVTPVPGRPVTPIASGPYSFRDRLLARRLARVQQMKADAAASGDAERMQQAEYLEGMVTELHKQGLFNFAQKFLSTMQQSEEPASNAPPAEIPEADLGEAAPLPGTELGEPAPLPGTDAEPIPDAPPEGE